MKANAARTQLTHRAGQRSGSDPPDPSPSEPYRLSLWYRWHHQGTHLQPLSSEAHTVSSLGWLCFGDKREGLVLWVSAGVSGGFGARRWEGPQDSTQVALVTLRPPTSAARIPMRDPLPGVPRHLFPRWTWQGPKCHSAQRGLHLGGGVVRGCRLQHSQSLGGRGRWFLPALTAVSVVLLPQVHATKPPCRALWHPWATRNIHSHERCAEPTWAVGWPRLRYVGPFVPYAEVLGGAGLLLNWEGGGSGASLPSGWGVPMGTGRILWGQGPLAHYKVRLQTVVQRWQL